MGAARDVSPGPQRLAAAAGELTVPPDPSTVPTFFPMASAQNRTESFAFDKPGRYLVICNVRPHLLDGMYAWVHVVDDDDN